MKHSWLLENFNYAAKLIDNNNFPNCLIITGNKSIGKKDLAKEISNYYLKADDDTQNVEDDINLKIIKTEDGSK